MHGEDVGDDDDDDDDDDYDDGDNSNCNGQHCFDGVDSTVESRIWAGAGIAKWDCL